MRLLPGQVSAVRLAIRGLAQRGQQGLDQFDLSRRPAIGVVVEGLGLGCRQVHQALAPIEQLLHRGSACMQRLHAARHAELLSALQGAQVCSEVVGPQQEGDGFPARFGDEADLRLRLGGQQQARVHRQAVHRPRRLRAEGHIGQHTLVGSAGRADADIGRMRDDRGIAEAHDHAPDQHRLRLQLHRILDDEFITLTGGGRVAVLAHGYGRVVVGSGGGRDVRVPWNGQR
jgi:hypothetical protein